jgi:acyl-CoA synthetase (AMP-forming)/AMP-acid ligase II
MIFRSPYPEVKIPATSLTPLVMRQAEQLKEKPAIIEATTGETLTYGQLNKAIRQAASALAQKGFKKGDVFAILSPNHPSYAVALHAIWLLGGITTTLNPLYTVEEIVFQLNDSQAKYLLTTPAYVEKAQEVLTKTKVEELFVFGEAAGATPFESLLGGDETVPQVAVNPGEDVAALLYSSGTTGFPKGVMLTHHNLVSNLVQIEGSEDTHHDDTVIAVLPLYHVYGQMVILNKTLYMGGTLITMPRFELESFLQAMQNYKVTMAPLAPPLVLLLAKHPLVEQYDLSNLRHIFSAAAPLSQEVEEACIARLGCKITQAYGMTEASPATHWSPDDPARIKSGSVGLVMPNTECKVVEVANWTEVGPNQVGEIWVRGPQVMKGYLNQPQATAATLDEEGWLHTGDIGYADEEGYFYIVDRLKELIKYKGMQVAPAELEAVILSHPKIADAAVIGVPDLEAGEIPKAFVVLKEEVSNEEIMAYVAQKVAPYKKIRQLEIIEQIPKSNSGKILRRVLLEKEKTKTQI